MLYLKSRVVEIATPTKIVNDKPRIIINRRQLKYWDYESQINVDDNDQTVIDHQLQRQDVP
jgi:hypothetical protein